VIGEQTPVTPIIDIQEENNEIDVNQWL
jgi:hypothetical protein